ncbi:hypothetical protein DR996_07250 [Vibrio owensii]|nr:hypothetical protein DR996_07250 [Vibrio owensii]
MPLTIITPFFISEGASFVNSKSGSIDVYFKCIVQLFHGLRGNVIYDQEIKLALVCNSIIPDKYHSQLKEFGVEMIIIEAEYCDNHKIRNKFPGSLFLLDAIKYFSLLNTTDVLILDSDILVNRELDLMNLNKCCDLVGYELGYNENHPVNGKSILDLKNDAYNILNSESSIKYFGGEFYYIPNSRLKETHDLVKICFGYYIEHDESVTEEHILSIVFSTLTASSITNKGIIKRVWNTFSFDNVDGKESEIALLHMPAEKGFGFLKLYNELDNFKNHNHSKKMYFFNLNKYFFVRKFNSLFRAIINKTK